MSLPPALLQRLAQRGLVQKPKLKEGESAQAAAVENEEVIAEDYDEQESDEAPHSQEEYQYPSQYDNETGRKRTEENFWLERMKARMGEGGSAIGYKGCPNKYNIWHKCTLFCVTRWADGKPEPSRDYMRRYKRLLHKYPLPKGWADMYDPGCGCYYFYSISDNLVSWLPPTHPKSQVTKSAAVYRRQLEEAALGEGGIAGGGSDGEQQPDDSDDQEESGETRHQREIDDIINASMRPRPSSPAPGIGAQDFPSLQETAVAPSAAPPPQRKQKSRDLDRALARQRRDRDKERDRSGYGHSSSARRHIRGDGDPVDPMDPSSYSDIPRGKWSDGLHTVNERTSSTASIATDDSNKERSGGVGGRERHDGLSDEEHDHSYD